MNHKLATSISTWKGNGNTTLLLSLKGLEILHQERRGQVNTIETEHFKKILFHKSRAASKQHSIPINQSNTCIYLYSILFQYLKLDIS
jgi:hypothetical protein